MGGQRLWQAAVARLTGPCRLTAFEANPSATLSAHAQSKAVNPRALQALAPAEEYGVRGWGTWGVAVAAAAVVFCAQGTRAHHAACQQRQAARFLAYVNYQSCLCKP